MLRFRWNVPNEVALWAEGWDFGQAGIVFELGAAEQDAVAEVGEVGQAACVGFNGLYQRVEAFPHGVGDRVRQVVEKVRKMDFKHPRHEASGGMAAMLGLRD